MSSPEIALEVRKSPRPPEICDRIGKFVMPSMGLVMASENFVIVSENFVIVSENFVMASMGPKLKKK